MHFLPAPEALVAMLAACSMPRPTSAPGNPDLPEQVAAWLAQSPAAAPQEVRARLKSWIAEYVPAQ